MSLILRSALSRAGGAAWQARWLGCGTADGTARRVRLRSFQECRRGGQLLCPSNLQRPRRYAAGRAPLEGQQIVCWLVRDSARPDSATRRHHREGRKVCGLADGGRRIRTSGPSISFEYLLLRKEPGVLDETRRGGDDKTSWLPRAASRRLNREGGRCDSQSGRPRPRAKIRHIRKCSGASWKKSSSRNVSRSIRSGFLSIICSRRRRSPRPIC